MEKIEVRGIVLKIKERIVEISLEEAESLYSELGKIFKNKEAFPPIRWPNLPYEDTGKNPYTPYWYWSIGNLPNTTTGNS